MINKETAFEIAFKAILNEIRSKEVYFEDIPKDNWKIYGLHPNCFYLELRNSILPGCVLENTLIVAIDRETGEVRYFGLANNEG